MKRVTLSLTGCIMVLAMLSGCSNVPVDPALPIITPPKDTVRKNGITISVEAQPASATLMLGEQRRLAARMVVTKDTTVTDSATKNFVLRDSSVTWTIISGDGSITASGLYTAPASIAGLTATVIVQARSNAEMKATATVTLTIRKPNLMPLAIGSYWTYETYPVDSLTGQRITSQKQIDSTMVVGSVLQGGRLTNMAINYRNGRPRDTVYYNIQNGVVWAYTKLSDNLSASQLQRQWLKVLDPNSQQWTAYDSTLQNVPVTINGQQGTMSGRLTLVCNRSTADSITTGAGVFNAQKYVCTFTVNMLLTVGGVTIPVQYSVPTTQWYADNTGLVRTISELFQVVNPFGGSLRKSSEESVLLRYALTQP
ncbi:MAG: hypothetical protein JNL32_10550 [Candidatus Kapabacteria bacterium]|nr:hypothetical protein [Candidatus Kapabacteria bacterium]